MQVRVVVRISKSSSSYTSERVVLKISKFSSSNDSERVVLEISQSLVVVMILKESNSKSVKV